MKYIISIFFKDFLKSIFLWSYNISGSLTSYWALSGIQLNFFYWKIPDRDTVISKQFTLDIHVPWHMSLATISRKESPYLYKICIVVVCHDSLECLPNTPSSSLPGINNVKLIVCLFLRMILNRNMKIRFFQRIFQKNSLSWEIPR